MRVLFSTFAIIIFSLTMFISCNEDENIPDITIDFEADNTTIESGGTIKFTDKSTGNPTNWRWIIEGSEILTSTDQNPSITFNTPGSYNVVLDAKNSSKSGELIKENYIEVIDPLSIGLVGYYPFNGNGNDESGNILNGVVNGATLTIDRKGNPNSAL